MKTKKQISHARKGSALLLTLYAAVLLLVAGVGLLGIGLRGRITAARNSGDIVARCAADAGLVKAVYQMNQLLQTGQLNDAALPQATNQALPTNGAMFSYTVTKNYFDGIYGIEAVGSYGYSQKRVYCMLPLTGPFESAIACKQGIGLKAGTTVTAYNSTDSSASPKARVATNSTSAGSVLLYNGVLIDGDVVVGPRADPATVVQDHGATFDRIYSMTEEIAFPLPVPPALPNKGVISIQGTTLVLGPADSGLYTDVTIKKQGGAGTLDIQGGEVIMHVTGDVTLFQSCEISISPDASLRLYLDGDLTAGNNASINNSNPPTNFTLYGTSNGTQTLELKAKGDFSGAIYAPNASAIVKAGGDVYGACTVTEFEMKSSGTFYYDEALKQCTTSDQAVSFTVKQWGEQ